MAASPSSMPSSMLTSMMLAPAFDLLAGDGHGFSNWPARTMRANFFEPVTFVRSPIISEVAVRPQRQAVPGR